MFDFVYKAVGGELATSEETSECRWVPKENVLDFITLPAIRLRYETYLNFDGSVNFIDYVTETPSECSVKTALLLTQKLNLSSSLDPCR